MEKCISRYGIPLELHTDQERDFELNLFSEICKQLRNKENLSFPYRARTLVDQM